VSGTHCELTVVDGHWLVKDRGSSNGTKVNGSRVTEQRLESGDKISFGRNVYEIFYNPAALGADVVAGGDVQTDVFATSLLSAAGLERRRAARDSQSRR
jgi:predicted component of type VI protein secretion system